MEIIYYGIIIIVIGFLIVKFLAKKKTPARNSIFIVGEVGSGKTSLLYYVRRNMR